MSSPTRKRHDSAAEGVPAPWVPGLPRIVVTVPTYDEAENILELSRQLLELGPNYQVLVVDDDSPDGTWKLVRDAAQDEPRLHLLHRVEDRGRGWAGRDGFVLALEMGAEIVVEMDADFSHHPRYVPALVARLLDTEHPAGLVLGSRGVAGGSDADRSGMRQVITKAANAYIRLLLGVNVRDGNSGFRCWSADTLRAIRVEETFSQGPAIVQELLFKTARAGIPVAEVPIEFVDRTRGESTLTFAILMRGYTTVLALRWMALRGKL